MVRTKNKIKLIRPILFKPTNVIKKMLDFILANRPELETQSQVIRVAIVRLYNETNTELLKHKEGRLEYGHTEP